MNGENRSLVTAAEEAVVQLFPPPTHRQTLRRPDCRRLPSQEGPDPTGQLTNAPHPPWNSGSLMLWLAGAGAPLEPAAPTVRCPAGFWRRKHC